MNATQEQPSYMKLWESSSFDYYKVGIFIFIMMLSFTGNLLVIITIATTQKLKNVTNFFLLNLALADTLVTVVCMPINLAVWFDHTVLHDQLVCKSMPFLQGASVCCSVYTLTLIAIDRYMVILHPLGRRIQKHHCFIIILIIWCAAMVTASPSLIVNRVGVNNHTGFKECDEYGWSQQNKINFTYTLMVLTYFFPLLSFFFIYGKIIFYLWYRKVPGMKDMPPCVQQQMKKKCLRRKKIVKVLGAVVVTFLLCHLPMNVMNILWYTGWQAPAYMPIIGFHAQVFLYLSTATNPMVYALFHGRIKEASIVTLKWLFCCEERHLGFHGDKRSTARVTLDTNTRTLIKKKKLSNVMTEKKPLTLVTDESNSQEKTLPTHV